MILIKCVDNLRVFLSTNEIAQLNKKLEDVEEHTSFDEVEGDYISLTPDKNSKFEIMRIADERKHN